MLSTNVAPICIYYSLGFFFRDYCLGFVHFGDKKNLNLLQHKVDGLSKKMGVHVPITVSANNRTPWAAHGCQCYGSAGITVPHTEKHQDSRTSEELQTAILAHEIAHIKRNDGMWLLIIPIITALATTILLSAFVSIGTADAMGLVAGIVAFIIRNRFQEAAADAEACKYLNNKEKLAMIADFERIANMQKTYRNQKGFWVATIFRKIFYDREGRTWFSNLTHPSYHSRIATIRSSMVSTMNSRRRQTTR